MNTKGLTSIAAIALVCLWVAACAKHSKSEKLSALENAYRAGIITKAEYENKKAAYGKWERAAAALEDARKSGVLTNDEYLAKKAALSAPAIPASAAETPVETPGAAIPSVRAESPQAPLSLTAAPKDLRVQPVFDPSMGNMLALRFLVPRDWKAEGKTVWTYRDLYVPVRGSIHAESPDGSAWYDGYAAEDFFFGDHEAPNPPPVSFGAIHYRNIDVQQAMTRYIIGRYRAHSTNLKILGYRPVNNLGQALGKPDFQGDGICFRVRYEIDGQPVDEEFYGVLCNPVRYSYTGPQGTWYEYHRQFALVHSFGAKNGKLEAVRPILGSIAPSMQVDKAWAERAQKVRAELNAEFSRQLQRGFDQIRAAGEMSKIISANNDRFIQQMDAERAARNASSSASRSSSGDNGAASFERRADDFDQYIRDTEHVVDAWGQVSDQSNQYNYHWTDGWGNWIHSNDANYNPNTHSATRFEQAKPIH